MTNGKSLPSRSLGSSGIGVSAIGLGCMSLSGTYGTSNDDEGIALIHEALDRGITLLDTSDAYGNGHNETLVGKAIAGRRSGIVLATKFGNLGGRGGKVADGRPEYVVQACEASLKRLGVETIDLYYQHRIDPTVPIEDTVGAMAQLVTEGKVGHLGVSEVTPAQLGQAAAVHPISAVQFEWSLLWRDPEDDIIPAARRLGTGIVPYSPLGRGMLTATLTQADIDGSDFRRGDPRFQGGDLDQNLARVAALRRIADGLGLTPAQLALAWLLAQGPDVVPIPGTRRLDRIEQNAAAADVELTEDDLRGLSQAVPRAGWAGDRTSFAAVGTSRRTGPADG